MLNSVYSLVHPWMNYRFISDSKMSSGCYRQVLKNFEPYIPRQELSEDKL